MQNVDVFKKDLVIAEFRHVSPVLTDIPTCKMPHFFGYSEITEKSTRGPTSHCHLLLASSALARSCCNKTGRLKEVEKKEIEILS